MARRDFEVSIDDKAAYRAVRRLLATVDDLRPTLLRPLVYPALLDAEREHFQSARFAPLSPKYAKWKSAHAPGKHILQNTGGLMASFTDEGASRSGSGGGQYKRFEKRRMAFGSTWPTAHLHQAGRGSRLPSRPPLAPYPIINKHLSDAYKQWTHDIEAEWRSADVRR